MTENPASKPVPAQRKRIPLSVPQLRLEVPPIPGHSLYWFLEKNTLRALQGGYEFVDQKEVSLNARNVASLQGNTDMGSRVSVVAGTGADGQPESLFLMKIKQEWFNDDQALLADRNHQIQNAIKHGSLNDDEKSTRYVKTAKFTTS